MTALLLAAAVATQPNERVYRLTLHGAGDATVAIRVEGPRGWLQTVCTAQTCSIGHATMHLSRDGVSRALLHVYRMNAASPFRATIEVRAGAASARRFVRFK
jgi:hypothetical protein